MAPPLSASARSVALKFAVAGKSPADLLKFLKSYDNDEWQKLKTTKERYPIMVAVQNRLVDLQREEQEQTGAGSKPKYETISDEEEEEEEEEVPTKGKAGTKRKVSSNT